MLSQQPFFHFLYTLDQLHAYRHMGSFNNIRHPSPRWHQRLHFRGTNAFTELFSTYSQ